ncbi:MAG: hypothetical protein GH150_04700 [Hadesarchaea archaeon]|nr:hypothetical protein [Hadesarchaea archaeon]
MKVKIKRGDQNFEMEVEPNMRITLKDSEIEFERPLRVSLSGEGRANCSIPAVIFARSLRIEGTAKLETEETIERIMKPRKVRGVQRRVLDAIEGEMTSEEVMAKTELTKKQVWGAITVLIKKGLVKRREHKICKVGITHPDPHKQRNLEIPVVEK